MISKLTVAALLVACQISDAYAQGTPNTGSGANGASSSADVKNSDKMMKQTTRHHRHKQKYMRASSMSSMKSGGGDNGASSSADVKNSDKMQGKKQ